MDLLQNYSKHVWTAEEIREFRVRYNMSQAALSFFLGCKRQQTISEWELGLYKPQRSYNILLNFLKRDFEKLMYVCRGNEEIFHRELQVAYAEGTGKNISKMREKRKEANQETENNEVRPEERTEPIEPGPSSN